MRLELYNLYHTIGHEFWTNTKEMQGPLIQLFLLQMIIELEKK